MGTSNIVDKVVVITGASSGIGESTAKFLAQRGAEVVLGARRKDRIDSVVKEISSEGGKAIGLAVDVAKRSDVEALIKGAVESFDRVDVLVNNAGIMPIAPIPALKVEEWDRQIDINIKGVLHGVAAALPQMLKQKSGHIINIASVFGIKVFAPGGTVYCATKAAIRTLTEGLRRSCTRRTSAARSSRRVLSARTSRKAARMKQLGRICANSTARSPSRPPRSRARSLTPSGSRPMLRSTRSSSDPRRRTSSRQAVAAAARMDGEVNLRP